MDRVKSDTAARAVRIFLLIGNRLLRDTLLRLFRKPADVSIVGQGSPAATARADMQEAHCDVILTDSIPASTSASDDPPAQNPLDAELLLVGMEDDEELFLTA